MNKKIFFSFIVLFLVGCASRGIVNYSNLVFNPSTENGRKLKSLYTKELNDIVGLLSSSGLKVLENGIGFTDGSICSDCINEPGDFWLFVTVRHKNFNNDNKSELSYRAEKVAEAISSDILFFVKDANLTALYSDKSFRGILLGASWINYEKLKDFFHPHKYESLDLFVPKDIFIKYVQGEKSSKELLKGSKLYFRENEIM